jgi:hypothetical protein
MSRHEEIRKYLVESAIVDTWHKYGGLGAAQSGMVNMPSLMADAILEALGASKPVAWQIQDLDQDDSNWALTDSQHVLALFDPTKQRKRPLFL